MNRNQLDALRTTIVELEENLKQKKLIVQREESACQHSWGEPIRTSVHKMEERIDWSRPIHQGSDFWYGSRFDPVSVPAWTRTCSKCGKTEQTTATKDKVTTVPSF